MLTRSALAIAQLPSLALARAQGAGLSTVLLLAWASLLGIQLHWQGLGNFRFSPSDVALAVLLIALATREAPALRRALRPNSPLHYALALLAVALAWGAAVALIRTGILVREGWFNKGLGVLVLAAIFVAVVAVVRDAVDARRLLAVTLTVGSAISWVAFGLALANGWLEQSETELRFHGLLLNPSANGIFLSVLVVIQIGSVLGRQIVSWPLWLQYTNALGLNLLLVATLSRSTWVAALFAFVPLALALVRRTRLPAVLAVVLLVFTFQPLAVALSPIGAQLARGEPPSSLRETRPSATPPPQVRDLVAAVPGPTRAPAPTSEAPGSPVAATAPPAATPEIAPGPVTRYLEKAGAISSEQYGASDRMGINVVALRLWLANPLTALTGIGLGVFFQTSPYMLIGVPLVIHSTYVWLPVEMGLAGLAVLLTLLGGMLWLARRAVERVEPDLATVVVGSVLLFGAWIAVNEGLYQRTLWLMLGVGVAVVTAAGRRRTVEGQP